VATISSGGSHWLETYGIAMPRARMTCSCCGGSVHRRDVGARPKPLKADPASTPKIYPRTRNCLAFAFRAYGSRVSVEGVNAFG